MCVYRPISFCLYKTIPTNKIHITIPVVNRRKPNKLFTATPEVKTAVVTERDTAIPNQPIHAAIFFVRNRAIDQHRMAIQNAPV